MFTHNSNEVSIAFRKPEKQPIDKKPTGLWFAEDASWLDFCRTEQACSEAVYGEMGDAPADRGIHQWDVRTYHHYLDIDMSKIALLDTPERLARFTEEFTYKGDDPMGQMKAMMGMGIDWSEVATKYDGIFIPEAARQAAVRGTQPMSMDWLATYDAGSGCVWSKNAIKECRLCTPNELNQLGVKPLSSADKVSKRPSQWSANVGH